MGPYCNFCGSRCFVPTTSDDYIKTDLMATCLEGTSHGMSKTFPVIYARTGGEFSKTDPVYGWLISLQRGEEFSLAAQLINGKPMEFEIRNKDLVEVIDFTAPPGENTYYRLND